MANTAPREGITYEQVAAAAGAMLGKELNPTIRSIREEIGGSPNTVHRHLTAWREARPKSTAETPMLPANLAAAFAAEISRAVAEARSEVEAKLVQAQAEAAELAVAGEALESEREALQEQIIAITAEHNTLTGKSGEQASEIVRLSAELERERTNSEQGRIEIAQSRNKIESLIENLNEKSATIERLTAAGAAETQSRIAAEKNAAVLQARLDASLAQIEELKTRESKLSVEVEKERHAAEQARTEGRQRQDKIEAQISKLTEQSALIDTLKARVDTLEKEAARLKTLQDPESQSKNP